MTRVDEPRATDLSSLQDRLPPFPGSAAREMIEEELGQSVGVLFRAFDDVFLGVLNRIRDGSDVRSKSSLRILFCLSQNLRVEVTVLGIERGLDRINRLIQVLRQSLRRLLLRLFYSLFLFTNLSV